MKGFASLGAMVIVLLALCVYIYFPQKSNSPMEGIVPAAKALAIPKDQVDGLVIRSSTGNVSTLAKSGTSWKIIAPFTAPADNRLVGRIVSLLGGVDLVRVVDEQPTDLAQYGLAPPKSELTIKTTGSEATQQVLFGARAPVGSSVYAQVSPNPRVILIASEFVETVDKSPVELRDNGIFTIDRDSVDTVEIDVPGHAVTLVKQGLDWELKRPLHAHGDLGVVSELLTRLKDTQMGSIVESPAPPSTYRLDRPTFTLTLASGSVRETVQIGGEANAGNFYARNLTRPMVFTIPAAIVDSVAQEPGHYRRKDVFEFQSIDATRLEVTAEGQTTVYRRPTAQGSDGKWQELSPSTRAIEPAVMDNVLSKLSYLRAVTFVPTPAGLTGRATDRMSIVVQSENGRKSDGVRLATLGSEAFALRADWPDAARLDSNAHALLMAAIADLRK